MSRFRSTALPLLAAALISLAAVGSAMAALTGDIVVTVVDKDGQPVVGATVMATSASQLGERAQVTGANGVVRFNDLGPGDYTLRVGMEGYGTLILENNPVRLDGVLQVQAQLSEELTEEVRVSATPPVVDTTSSQLVSQDLTREFVDALPIGRDFLTNLSRVPGVGLGANPSVKGATSRDNLFLIDGVNTTDPTTGTFGANVNFEIIDQHNVTVAGHSVENGGVVGMVSNLVTKSGGNDWSGSAVYFLQDGGWNAKTKRDAIAGTTIDSDSWAYTLGGPVIKDKLWHFSSFSNVFSESFLANQDPDRPPREFDGDRFFGKLTWQATNDHRLQGQWNYTKEEILNVNAGDPTIKSDQFRQQDQGGDIYTLKYTGILGPDFVLEGQLNAFRSNLDSVPQRPDLPPNHQALFGTTEQFGRYVNEQFSDRNRDEIRIDGTYFIPTSWGDHNLRAGIQFVETELVSLNINSGGESFEDLPFAAFSLASFNASFEALVLEGLAENNGWTCTEGVAGPACGAGTLPTGDWIIDTGTTQFQASDMLFFEPSVNPDAAAAGFVVFRQFEDRDPFETSVGQEITSLYVEDEWRIDDFTVRLGARVDKQELLDTQGGSFFKFDTVFGPRAGVTWDIKGDGRSKLFANWGILYDPLRDNTPDFAGTTNSPILANRIYVDPLGDYFDYSLVGGMGTPGAVISPTTKTPKTKELLTGYAIDFGNNWAFETSLTYRKTTQITEDWDPIVQNGDPDTYPTLQGSPTLEGLGFTDENSDGTVDDEDLCCRFVIYNPPGAQRKAYSWDVIVRKQFANAWQGLFSYSWLKAEGNLPADGLYGSIGDDPYEDPRLPYNFGRYDRDHLVQVQASYRFPFGLTVGGDVQAYSGAHYSLDGISTPDAGDGIWDGDPAKIVDTLSIDRDEFSTELGIPLDSPLLDEMIVGLIPLDLKPGRGAYEDPWNFQVNMRLRYDFRIWKDLLGEAFFDVFNMTNVQRADTEESVLAVTESVTPDNIGDSAIYETFKPISSQRPRRYQFGLRLKF